MDRGEAICKQENYNYAERMLRCGRQDTGTASSFKLSRKGNTHGTSAGEKECHFRVKDCQPFRTPIKKGVDWKNEHHKTNHKEKDNSCSSDKKGVFYFYFIS